MPAGEWRPGTTQDGLPRWLARPTTSGHASASVWGAEGDVAPRRGAPNQHGEPSPPMERSGVRLNVSRRTVTLARGPCSCPGPVERRSPTSDAVPSAERLRRSGRRRCRARVALVKRADRGSDQPPRDPETPDVRSRHHRPPESTHDPGARLASHSLSQTPIPCRLTLRGLPPSLRPKPKLEKSSSARSRKRAAGQYLAYAMLHNLRCCVWFFRSIRLSKIAHAKFEPDWSFEVA